MRQSIGLNLCLPRETKVEQIGGKELRLPQTDMLECLTINVNCVKNVTVDKS